VDYCEPAAVAAGVMAEDPGQKTRIRPGGPGSEWASGRFDMLAEIEQSVAVSASSVAARCAQEAPVLNDG
jgi:hypothetical protein